MLISSAGEERGEGRRGAGGAPARYQTANELFELMTKDRHFETNADTSLTNQDLVLLYKNLDIGTRLMTDNLQLRRPNQHVETVVYNDDHDSDSDLSDSFSTEDLLNVFKVNQERLDMFNNNSFDNILCHKLGDLEIQPSNLLPNDKRFFFKDPYIKQHLKSFANTSGVGNALPSSLLDYICCKRLEDNYTFYMDNIISYVQHTIEHLKRISNGDFLTDRTKEKWMEVNSKDSRDSNTKVLANSTSIPLYVECKNRNHTARDDIVHSEIDIRSLSKILEKKIVIEIPKLICGSYRLFSKRCADNLIISCKKEKEEKSEDSETRVDVVLKLQRSETGQVISNINSIMILQTTPSVKDTCLPAILPLPYKDHVEETKENDENKDYKEEFAQCIAEMQDFTMIEDESIPEDVISNELEEYQDTESNDYPISEEFYAACEENSNQLSSESSVHLREILDKSAFQVRNEATFDLISPNELRLTMQRLNMQTSLPEESGEDLSSNQTAKRRSPVRVRIKSPYENKSFIMEEKKRKRLLEIREKREKKKIALSENCKVSKHRGIKGGVMPQPSSSVTKLSITNKSFYNSIYGQSVNLENKTKGKLRKYDKRDHMQIDVPIATESLQDELYSPNLTPENHQKYINRSYYLDDTETEMMKLNDSKSAKICSPSTSTISNDYQANMCLFSQFMEPANVEDLDLPNDETLEQSVETANQNEFEADDNGIIEPDGIENLVPVNTPKDVSAESKKPNIKTTSTVECRKSIEKLYDLMKKLGKGSTADIKRSSSKLAISNNVMIDATAGTSTIQESESGTSLKHQLTSSNPSCFSFGKAQIEKNKHNTKKQDKVTVPKVIISSKLQTFKLESEKLKSDRKKVIVSTPTKTTPENPLKAISQLLHEFGNVQKTRQKALPDTKSPRSPRKSEIPQNDPRNAARQASMRRRSRIDQHIRDNEHERNKTVPIRERRAKPTHPIDMLRIPHQQVPIEEKPAKKKMIDIIEEAKEARGEAVRGPSKFGSRLNTLAQPKRSYVQAHSEEFQHKYGRNLMADRLQRLATAPPERNVTSAGPRPRSRRGGTEATSNVSVKQLSPRAPLEKSPSDLRSASSSPNRRRQACSPGNNRRLSDSPEARNKMVAVESYVKSHYGRGSPSSQPSELLLAGHKSRVPLLPNDIDLASMASSPYLAEANELGNKLHSMINSMLAPPLTAVTESREHSNTDKVMTIDITSRDDRSDSEFSPSGIEDQNIRTAVELQNANQNEENAEFVDTIPLKCNIQGSSKTELEKLESALCSHMSGAFQKRLRIKNLTLTPKQSMQNMFLLQSGDTGAMLVNSLSKIKVHDADSLLDLKDMPVFSNTHLKWDFIQIPMQLTTVGYAFSSYNNEREKTTSKVIPLNYAGTVETCNGTSCTSDKVSQVFKGAPQEPKAEQAAQANTSTRITPLDVENNVVQTEYEPSSPKAVMPALKDEALNEISNEEDSCSAVDKSSSDNEKTIPDVEKGEAPLKPYVCDKNITVDNEASPEYTSSLDMLVGLLNEIKKITRQNEENDGNFTNLETTLNNAAALEERTANTRKDFFSMTSLEDLKKLESNCSLYSLYVPNNKSISKPNSRTVLNVDLTTDKSFLHKEVNVNFEKELVNTFTEVPSNIFPVANNINHSTNVTKSLIGVLSEPSNQSILSFPDYKALLSNELMSETSVTKILELPCNDDVANIDNIKPDLNEKSINNFTPAKYSEGLIVANDKNRNVNQYYTENFCYDPALKIKRDVLVTVYSILVLTVFAALSFPELIMLEG